MRKARLKASLQEPVAHYHCISRIVDRRFVLGDLEKEQFIAIMRHYERFCGVSVVTYCILDNHFHLLVEVPRMPDPDQLPDDQELVRRVGSAGGSFESRSLKADLQRFRREGNHQAAEALRQRYFHMMWDISWFLRLLKQRFTQGYNANHARTGTLWEGRFRSVLVEGGGAALGVIAAYIDLNPLRAGIVHDPKDYRWSGYGEAVGGGKLAQAGLKRAAEALFGAAGSSASLFSDPPFENLRDKDLPLRTINSSIQLDSANCGRKSMVNERHSVARLIRHNKEAGIVCV